MEFINAGITFDGSGVQAGMKEAADAIKKGGEDIGKAATDAATKSDFAFKSLTQAYRQTSKDAQLLAETQGINSAAFLDAATKAGEYKNKLDDVNLAINALSAEKPVLAATLNLAKGIAGGIAAAQGAMAMFGGKSKEVDEALKKVQGSMALLQGLSAVSELGDAWKGFTIVLNTKVIPALMTTRGILITTGIGAIAAVVGFLAYKWVEESEAQEKATEAHKKFLEAHFKDAQFAQETQTMLTEAQADSLNKRIALQSQANLKEQTELTKKFKDNEISQTQYNARMQALETVNQAKLADIRNNWAKEHPLKREDQQTINIKKKGGLLPTDLMIPPLKLEGADFAMTQVERLTKSFTIFGNVVELTVAEFKTALKDQMGGALAEFATMAGEQLAGVDVSFSEAGLKFIASLAGTIGKGLIAIGLPMIGAIATAGEGFALIAAGTALMALSGAVGASAGGGKSASVGSASGGGGYSGASGGGTFQPQTSFFSATGILYGNDMLLAIQKSNQKMQRVK